MNLLFVLFLLFKKNIFFLVINILININYVYCELFFFY